MGFHVALSDTSDRRAQGGIYVSLKKNTEQTPFSDKENAIFAIKSFKKKGFSKMTLVLQWFRPVKAGKTILSFKRSSFRY